jgi:hypothetical protein
MATKVYAGIGSRRTPDTVLDLIERLAGELAAAGWLLRSGHVPGAGQAFERGADADAEVFLPWPTFEIDVPVLAGEVVRGTDRGRVRAGGRDTQELGSAQARHSRTARLQRAQRWRCCSTR